MIPIFSTLGKFALAIVTFSTRLEKTERKVTEIEKNYLSRFEDMTAHVTKVKEDIIEHQHAMELRLMDKMK